jgi:hypothetical protein
MAFTQDELQALHAILGQKLADLLPELEQFFDQRMHILQNEFKQDMQKMQASIEIYFSTQLLAFEQLIDQRFPAANRHVPDVYANQPQTSFEAIEVQTDIPWEDLVDLLNKALNERFIPFTTAFQARLREIEQKVLSQIQLVHDDLHKEQPIASFASMSSAEPEMQDILASISQLEHIIESMQVAMTANSTLISNRLYHHQHLPMERAHPAHSFSPSEHEHTLEREWSPSPSASGEGD